MRAADPTIDPFLKSAVSAAASPTPRSNEEDQTDTVLGCATVGAPKFAPSSSSPSQASTMSQHSTRPRRSREPGLFRC
jgi:hypothetical protein